MYARLLAFSNGDLQALYDRSDGFYHRQLILTTKDKPLSRVDDPDIAEKMAAEVEGILLWAFEGLQRLVKNGFQFTESDRAKRNRELAKRGNNVFDFLEYEVFLWVPAVSKVFFQLRIQTIFHEFSDGILEQFLNVVHAADICKLQQFTDFLSPGFFFRASGHIFPLHPDASILHLSGGLHNYWAGLREYRLWRSLSS